MYDFARPYVMSIAGYDPSGGAGVLADIKVFEQHRTYGFAIITSNTFQNDKTVKDIHWLPVSDIIKQMDIILDSFNVPVFKIGILENEVMLTAIKNHILKRNVEAKIIWDPVLKASSGFKISDFGKSIDKVLDGIYVITPNLPEFNQLIGSDTKAREISERTAIYLKGGHNTDNVGVDELIVKGEKINLLPYQTNLKSKHGSGCILSSAIAANLALRYELEKACRLAKVYTENKLASNNTLLAYHH